jgi:chemotaxis protein methyltransferase CheR
LSAAAGPSASLAIAGSREFGYTQRDFQRVRRLIHRRAGIALNDSKVDMVYSRLARRLRALGLQRMRDYLDLVEADAGAEWQAFTNALTTNLTSFFREPHHFEVLRDWLARVPPTRPIRIWCAAASTGEEPYSIAMAVMEHYRHVWPPVSILATDVDTSVLATAEEGIYPEDRVQSLSKPRLRRFFRRGTGEHSGYVRVADYARALVRFEPLNLLDDRWPVDGPLDVIFCRNVMIYFDKDTQRRILSRFVPLLAADGLLLAGHSESFLHAADLFRPCGRTVYRLAAPAGGAG